MDRMQKAIKKKIIKRNKNSELKKKKLTEWEYHIEPKAIKIFSHISRVLQNH